MPIAPITGTASIHSQKILVSFSETFVILYIVPAVNEMNVKEDMGLNATSKGYFLNRGRRSLLPVFIRATPIFMRGCINNTKLINDKGHLINTEGF
jgi:hypothetical protein